MLTDHIQHTIHKVTQYIVSTVQISLFVVSFNAFSAEYVSHQLTNNKLTIVTDSGVVALTALTGNAFEVLHQSNLDEVPFPSFSIDTKTYRVLPVLNITEGEHLLTISSSNIKAVINKAPFNISFYKNSQLLLQEESGYFNQNSTQGFRFKLTADEKLMGTGERVLGMNRRGHKLPLYNKAHYGYGTESSQMNFSIPAVISSKKYMVLFDNTANGWVDLGKTESDILQFSAEGGRSSYIVIVGEDHPNLINNYVDITGKQPLPPRWAFGNHASRFGYRSQQQVLDTIAKYKSEDIPVDSIILDLYWFGKDVKGHMGNLDWDRETFPDPIKMINELKQQDVKTILISEPFILTSSKRWQEAVDHDVLAKDSTNTTAIKFDFYFGNTGLLDVFSDKTQRWFGNIYQELATQGVAGVWGDLGEPEVHPANMQHTLSKYGITASGNEIHNVYGHQWAKLVNESLLTQQPNVRPFIIMRSGFAGSQRYGMIPWTGDVSRSWQGLQSQVELSLQMSLLGMAYTHSDLGGFAGGDKFDKEMYIRWLQYGVFQPIYRPHAQDNIAPEPIFHDTQTKDIIRQFIKLRYRMLPYNYTLAYQNSISGMPLMRPMFFADETNNELIDINDQYMWGDSFLIKPVTQAQITSVPVLLPSGNWFNYWNDEMYNGEQTISYPVNLSIIPVLVKGGAIIPTTNDMMNTEQYKGDQITLDYYFDPEVANSKASIFNDDGLSTNTIKQNQFEIVNVTVDQQQSNNQRLIELTLSKENAELNTNTNTNTNADVISKDIKFIVHNWQGTEKNINLNGKKLNFVDSKKALIPLDNAAYLDTKTNLLVIKFRLSENKLVLKIIN